MWQRLTVCGRSRWFPSFPCGFPMQRKIRSTAPWQRTLWHTVTIFILFRRKRMRSVLWQHAAGRICRQCWKVMKSCIFRSTKHWSDNICRKKRRRRNSARTTGFTKNMDRITVWRRFWPVHFPEKSWQKNRRWRQMVPQKSDLYCCLCFMRHFRKRHPAARSRSTRQRSSPSAFASLPGFAGRKKMRHTHPGYNRKSRDLQCANSRDCWKRARKKRMRGSWKS